MKIRKLLLEVVIISVLLVFLLANIGVVAFQKKRVLILKGEGSIFNYSEEIYWNEEEFNREYKKYSENKRKYLGNFIKNFSANFLKSALEATDWSISFKSQYSLKTQETLYFTSVQCRINGAATGTAESPYFRTEWLLVPLLGRSIDLYNFQHFADKMLVYEGKVDHIPIKIIFKFSKPISHCHYHIWYR